MRYNEDIAEERKDTHLAFLLAGSDILADVLSFASVKNTGEFVVFADKGRDILADVASADAPPLVPRLYATVPSIGQTPQEKVYTFMAEADALFSSQHEAELEVNLALFYTILINYNGHALTSDRDDLIASADRKINPYNVYSRMIFHQRAGALHYLDAAVPVSQGRATVHDASTERSLQQSEDLLKKARDTARGYNLYHESFAAFNLGRIAFLRGIDKTQAQQSFTYAGELAEKIGNPTMQMLAMHYHHAADHHFGAIIDDPSAYQEQLFSLVTSILTPDTPSRAQRVSLDLR